MTWIRNSGYKIIRLLRHSLSSQQNTVTLLRCLCLSLKRLHRLCQCYLHTFQHQEKYFCESHINWTWLGSRLTLVHGVNTWQSSSDNQTRLPLSSVPSPANEMNVENRNYALPAPDLTPHSRKWSQLTYFTAVHCTTTAQDRKGGERLVDTPSLIFEWIQTETATKTFWSSEK